MFPRTVMKPTLCIKRSSLWEELVGVKVICSRANPDAETAYIKNHATRAAGLIFSGTFKKPHDVPSSYAKRVRGVLSFPCYEIDTPIIFDRLLEGGTSLVPQPHCVPNDNLTNSTANFNAVARYVAPVIRPNSDVEVRRHLMDDISCRLSVYVTAQIHRGYRCGHWSLNSSNSAQTH